MREELAEGDEQPEEGSEVEASHDVTGPDLRAAPDRQESQNRGKMMEATVATNWPRARRSLVERVAEPGGSLNQLDHEALRFIS